jgi:Protein of unknown function (DUF4240)
MNAAIKIPLRSLNPVLVRDLQEKYPEAEVSVIIHHDRNLAPLSEKYFWEIISLLDWSKEEDDDAVVEPAVAHLAAGPVRHILEFEDILSEKLYTLDSRTFAMHIGENAWSPDRYFSVDNFLYARCCVIANGEAFYQQLLSDPASMPKDLTFEALLYIASEAYERKTGKPVQYIPAFPFETYSNEAGWQ